MGPRTVSATSAFFALWCACMSVCGSPVPSQDILASVHALAVNCSDNILLEDSHTVDITVCGGSVPVKTRLQCLSFLDINRRLCALKSAPGFNLTERLRDESSRSLSAEKLCNTAGSFSIGSLVDYQDYANSIKKVLGIPAHCLKLCASDDILSEEPNHFCKVLHWGSNILKNISNEIERASERDSAQNPVVAAAGLPALKSMEYTMKLGTEAITGEAVAKADSIDASGLAAGNVISTPKIVGSTGNNIGANPIIETNEINNKEHTDGNAPSDTPEPKATPKTQISNKLPVADIPHTIVGAKMPETSEVRPPSNDQSSFDDSDPQGFPTVPERNGNVQPPLRTAGTSDNPPVQGPYEKAVGGGSDLDDYDRPGGASNLDENSVDDLDHMVKEIQVPQDTRSGYEQQYNSISPPDDYTEDDGRFFPMFFSGVVLMVLLYILYHNKSKVSTMVMGLIVEGRQPSGRRRNSRGHAYRRLDTLEQAISSGAPGATPSKIIY